MLDVNYSTTSSSCKQLQRHYRADFTDYHSRLEDGHMGMDTSKELALDP